MPDQTSRIRLGSVLPERVRNISDFPHPIGFHSSKEGSEHIVQNRPESDLDGLVRFWPNASGPEASQCARVIGPGFWQNANDPPPVSHFQTRLRSSAGCPDHNYCAEPAWIWLTVSGLGQTDPDRKQAGVKESSDWMLIASGMFSLLSLVQPRTQAIALTYLNFGVT